MSDGLLIWGVVAAALTTLELVWFLFWRTTELPWRDGLLALAGALFWPIVLVMLIAELLYDLWRMAHGDRWP